MSNRYEVLATVNVDDVTTSEVVTVPASDPDDACGAALGELRGRFGDDAEIWLAKISQVLGGNTPVLA